MSLPNVMRRNRPHHVRPRGILSGLLEALRGREQRLVRAGDVLPLLLLSYPRGAGDIAAEIEAAWAHTFPRLSDRLRSGYDPLWAALPLVVVVQLYPYNACQCLGHRHPPGTESRLARRLSADLGRPAGEIDLAYEAIRNWQPDPLASLAAAGLGSALPKIHFQAAILGVLLHELEHLAFPDRTERDVRLRSNDFYSAAMRELVRDEAGAEYGIASRPPRG